MADSDPIADPDRCTATAKSTGERCKQPAIPGGEVCRFHGGAAEQVENKAQERLDKMADTATARMQDRLGDIFDRLEREDLTHDEYVKLMREARQLTTDILDRTGVGPEETTKVAGEDGGPLDFTVNYEVVDDGDE
jgi:uncharacterized protein YjbJ (UPF0337 family)